MSRDRSDRSAEPAVRVVDRRRFGRDGRPLETSGRGGEESAGAEPGAPAPGRGPEEPAAPAPAEAGARLAAQAARIDELARAYAALLEDNKAFRARMERERDRAVEAERARLFQALLDAADELTRALAAIPAEAAEKGGPLATLQQGVRLTLSGLSRRIADLGAVRIEVAGKPFDPRVAEAVDVVAVAEAGQDGLVLAEVRPGYAIGERVLRPARVRVGRLAPGNGTEPGGARE